MSPIPFWLKASAAITCASLPAGALEIRSYDEDPHDRFDGFPSTPVENTTNLFAAQDLTGVGWLTNGPALQPTLVSRQHVVFATHFVQPNQAISFLSSSGQVVQRSYVSSTVIMDGGNPSDLSLLKLASPIDDDLGVRPLPYLDLANSNDYQGLAIGVIGRTPDNPPGLATTAVTGRGSIAEVENMPRTVGTLNATRFMRFSYRVSSGNSDDCHFASGDSGSPTFVVTGGTAALVGTHSYVAQTGAGGNTRIQNYDAFLPHYVTALDVEMEPLGYRMRPVNAPSTTLAGSSSTVETTPRQGLPLTLEFALENTGANLTGNLEVVFEFPAGQEPDSVSASGWVSYGSGTKWTLRRATLAAAATETLTASWAEAPVIASLTPTITWRSDTVADQSSSPVINLSPSYAVWADGLAEGELTDDPDLDTIVNQLEYAFGGDPEDGIAVLPNGEPLLPTISFSGGLVTLCHPERGDKAERGLDYTPEWSTGLSTPSWTTTPPPGMNSSTAAYVPDVPGFVKRTITWPAAEARHFVRIGVTLNE